MSRKFKHALKELKHTYPAPDPEREAAFLRNLPEQTTQKKSHLPLLHTGHKTLWYSVPALVTAAVLLVIGTGIYRNVSEHRLPTAEPSEQTTTAAVSEVTPSESLPQETPEAEGTFPVQTDMTEQPVFEGTDSVQSLSSQIVPQDGTQRPLNEAPSSTVLQETAIPSTEQEGNTAAPIETSVQQPTDQDPSPIPSEGETPQLCPEPTLPTEPNNEPLPPSINTDPPIVLHDYTVKPAFRYTVSETVLENVLPPSDIPPLDVVPGCQSESWQSMATSADLIVLAHVDSMIYTKAGIEPYTQLNVTIDAIYKGSISIGDKISVYEEGGYLPLSAAKAYNPDLAYLYQGYAEDTSVRFPGGSTRATAAGNSFVLFLNRSANADIPSGAYLYTKNMDESRFTLSGANMKSADGKQSMTLSDLRYYLK